MNQPTPFTNEPVLELRRAAVRNQLAGALEALDAQLPLSVPVIVGSDQRAGQGLVSTDPGQPGNRRSPTPWRRR
jgi:RHH-type transcriptional regulator, proline utilization regulon repressor / proline dehydrogenase / delta 1-pyrroline-5-carboxylate dehydrogenase